GVLHYAPMSEFFEPERSPDVADLPMRIDRWRTSDAGERYLLVAVTPSDAASILDALQADDLVLPILAPGVAAASGNPARSVAAEEHLIHLGRRSSLQPSEDAWGFFVSEPLPDESVTTVPWPSDRLIELDRIARYITRREVGIAMSVGAAAGLAHF